MKRVQANVASIPAFSPKPPRRRALRSIPAAGVMPGSGGAITTAVIGQIAASDDGWRTSAMELDGGAGDQLALVPRTG